MHRLIMVKASRYSLQVSDDESPLIRRFGSFFLEPWQEFPYLIKVLLISPMGLYLLIQLLLSIYYLKDFLIKLKKDFYLKAASSRLVAN